MPEQIRDPGPLLGDLGRSLKHAEKAVTAALSHAERLRGSMIQHEEETTKDVLGLAERSKELRAENAELKRTRQRLDGEVSSLLAQLEEEKAAHERDVYEYKTLLDSADGQRNDLVAGHREELRALREELTQENERAIARLESSIEDYRGTLGTTEDVLKYEKGRLDEAHAETRRLTRELEESRGREVGAIEEADALRSELARMQRMMSAQVNQDKDEWQERLIKACREAEEEYARAERAELQLRDARTRIEELRSQVSHLNRTVSSSASELKKQKQAREVLNEKLGEYDQRVRDLNDRLEQMAEEHRRSIALARIGQEV